jgi:hypothetical protein
MQGLAFQPLVSASALTATLAPPAGHVTMLRAASKLVLSRRAHSADRHLLKRRPPVVDSPSTAAPPPPPAAEVGLQQRRDRRDCRGWCGRWCSRRCGRVPRGIQRCSCGRAVVGPSVGRSCGQPQLQRAGCLQAARLGAQAMSAPDGSSSLAHIRSMVLACSMQLCLVHGGVAYRVHCGLHAATVCRNAAAEICSRQAV